MGIDDSPESTKLPFLEKGTGQTSSKESLRARALPFDAQIAATTWVRTLPKRIGYTIGALLG
jgi:hypothetical protein